MLPDDFHGPVLEQICGVGADGFIENIIVVPEVVAVTVLVVVVVLVPNQEAVVVIKPSPGGPVLLVTEAQVPLANDVGRVVSCLEFLRQGREAGVQPVGNGGGYLAVVETGVDRVPRELVVLKIRRLMNDDGQMALQRTVRIITKGLDLTKLNYELTVVLTRYLPVSRAPLVGVHVA